MNIEHIEASILLINARLNALENILWGYLNVELEDREEGYSKEYRKMYYQFYIEQIHALQSLLPYSLAHNLIVKNNLECEIQDIEMKIAKLRRFS